MDKEWLDILNLGESIDLLDVRDLLLDLSQRTTSEVGYINKLKERAWETGMTIQAVEIHKKIEDGILRNLHKADAQQIDRVLGNIKFVYYDEYNDILSKIGTWEFVKVK
jgi:hypothetical protein